MVAPATANMGPSETEEAFNVELAVAAFLADEGQVSLELPSSLTAEQRKLAKIIVEKHPVLNSQTYGFGAERRLHLFKTGVGQDAVDAPQEATTSGAGGAASCVSIKNTFIDGWTGIDESAEPIVFRSMPAVKLPEQVLSALRGEEAKVDLSPVPESPSGNFGITDGVSPYAAAVSPAAPLEQEVQVRNTFVHYPEMREEERVVQSMPHSSTFSQRLREEAAERGQALPSWMVVAPPVVDANGLAVPADRPVGDASSRVVNEEPLPPGTEIMVEGLLRAPAFNGLFGVVQSFDRDTGRYSLLLQMREGGQQWAKVKRENLRLPPFTYI
jgi:hypothetical protein